MLTKVYVETWLDEWFELWPKGIKSGGYYIKTSKDSCLKKMIKFCEANPSFTKEIIINATKAYLNNRSQFRYAFTKLAPYFIEKDGISAMEGWCRDMEEKMSRGENPADNSESMFVKDI